MEDILSKRTEELKKLISNNKNYIIYFLLLIIIGIATKIRTANLGLLKSTAIDQYIPLGPDELAFYRYAQYILDHGQLMANDILRYVPYGYDPRTEFGFFSNLLAYSYKIISMVFSNITFDYYFVLFPVFSFIIFLIVYYFLVKNLFDEKIAILSSTIVGVAPAFIFRTISGATDKESLALTTMTIAMLFYVLAWKGKTMKFSLLLAILAGFFTAMTATVWGGVVFIYVILGVTAFILLLIEQLDEKDTYIYLCWWLTAILSLYILFGTRLPIKSFLFSTTTIITNFTFFWAIIDLLFIKYKTQQKQKVLAKVPRPILTFFITCILLITSAIIVQGFSFIIMIITDIQITLIEPGSTSRWGPTVIESRETYLIEWFSYFKKIPIILMLLGLIFLFREKIKHIKQHKKVLISFIFLVTFFIISKYSINSVLNGQSMLSKLLFIGSIMVFIIITLYIYFTSFYKDKETYLNITKIDKKLILITIWTLTVLIAAKARLRLILLLVPIGSVLISYALFYLYTIAKRLKNTKIRTASIIILFFIVFSPFASTVYSIPIIQSIPIINTDGFLVAMTKASYINALNLKPDYGGQKQKALSWIKENTSKDAVIGSWWDYGYAIQTLGERATISDGGNARGGINYYTGRYLLTSNNDTETLEFLYSNNVTHVMIPSEDIIKYPAYSLIGSNTEYDRYTGIIDFKLDPSKSKKQDNFNFIYYSGNMEVDKDYEYQGTKIPFKNSTIAAIIVPITKTGETIRIEQPKAAIYFPGKSEALIVPIECVFFNNKKVIYSEKGINSCIVILPTITNKLNPMGSLLYISEKAVNSFFTRYYFLNEKNKNFELVYSDEKESPFMKIGGEINGPVKVWKVNYPKEIKDNPFYRQTKLPDEKLYYRNNKY